LNGISDNFFAGVAISEAIGNYIYLFVSRNRYQAMISTSDDGYPSGNFGMIAMESMLMGMVLVIQRMQSSTGSI
jgi:hypothetical protein